MNENQRIGQLSLTDGTLFGRTDRARAVQSSVPAMLDLGRIAGSLGGSAPDHMPQESARAVRLATLTLLDFQATKLDALDTTCGKRGKTNSLTRVLEGGR